MVLINQELFNRLSDKERISYLAEYYKSLKIQKLDNLVFSTLLYFVLTTSFLFYILWGTIMSLIMIISGTFIMLILLFLLNSKHNKINRIINKKYEGDKP